MILHTIAPLTQWVSTTTRRRVALLFTWVIGYCLVAAPANAALGSKTAPDGIGGLFTIPDLKKGQAPLLMEAYSPQRYTIYQDSGWNDVVEKVSYPIYSALMEVSYAVVKLAVGLTWWLNEMTTYSAGSDSIASGIESAAGAMQSWLLPSAIALGALVAYVRARSGTEDVLGQVLSVALAAVAVIALSQSATTIVGGLDRGRVVLGETVNSLGAGAISQQNEPFKFSKDPALKGDAPHAVARKSGDVVWRSFYVTPWCQANFGSQAACKEYADGWLAQPNHEARKKYLSKTIAAKEGGSDSNTVKFIQGSSPGTRIGVALFALAIALGGAVVIGGMAFFALLPWLLALVLLFLVVFFICLMVVPGRPRQLGIDYVSTILGLTFFSALSGGLLAGMLLLMIQASKLSGDKGWLASMLMMVGALGAGWEARKLLQRMVTGSSGGNGMGALLGGLAMARMGGKMVGGVGKSLGSRRGAGSSRHGGSVSKSSSGSGTPTGQGLAYRTGQFAGALRHPRVAGGKGMNASGQFFKARGHAAADAVKSRAAGIGSAAGRGYASTGRATDTKREVNATGDTVVSSPSSTESTRTGTRQVQKRATGDRGSTVKNGAPARVTSTARTTRHPAGAHASGWHPAHSARKPQASPSAAPSQPASSRPSSRTQPEYASTPSRATSASQSQPSTPAPQRRPAPQAETPPARNTKQSPKQSGQRTVPKPRPRPDRERDRK